MGNSPSELQGWYTDEDHERRYMGNSSEIRARGRKRGNEFSTRSNLCDEKWDNNLTILDNVADGFGRNHDGLTLEFEQDMEGMFSEAGSSRTKDGTFTSTRMFSSVTKICNDGVAVSKSRGLSTNSDGRYKLAHQHRIGDRSQTLMRERMNKTEFKEYQTLHQISHDDLPKFTAEFRDRTKEWGAHRAIKENEEPRRRLDGRKPHLTLEDGRQSRSFHPPYSRPVSNQDYPRSEIYRF